MKNWTMRELYGKTYKESNVHVLNLMFEPDVAIAGLSRGKNISVKIGIGAKATDVANALIKAGQNIFEELKKG